jgi:hypothetical protein
MYKEISFRSVSKPGRITAPGFVLVRSEDGLVQQLRQQWRFGQTGAQEYHCPRDIICRSNLWLKNPL